MPNDPIRFICWPPSMVGIVIPGSVTRHCTVCLGEIWVAQSTLAEIKKRKLRGPVFWCVPCADRQLRQAARRGEKVDVASPTPEQVEEIAQDMRRRRQ